MKIKTKQSVGLWLRQRLLLSPAQAMLCSCIFVATMSLSQTVVFSQDNGSSDEQREPDLYEELNLIHQQAELARRAKNFDVVETLRVKRSVLLATSNSSNHVWVRSQKTINEAQQLFNGMQYRLAAKNLLNQWNAFEKEEEKRGRDAVYFGDLGVLLFTICEAAKTVDLVLVQTVEKKRDDDVEQNNPLRNDKQDQNNKLGKKDEASLESSDAILTQEEMLQILKLCAEDPCQSEAITMLAYVESPKKANAFMRAENRPDLRTRNQTLLTLGAEIENLGEIDVKDKTSVVVEYLKAQSTDSVLQDLELFKQFLDPRGKMSFQDETGETYELVLNDSILGYLDNTPTVLRYGLEDWAGHAVRGIVVVNDKIPPLQLGDFPLNFSQLSVEKLEAETQKIVFEPEIGKIKELLNDYESVCNGLEMAEKVQAGIQLFLKQNELDSRDMIRKLCIEGGLQQTFNTFRSSANDGFDNYKKAFPDNAAVVDGKLLDLDGRVTAWFQAINSKLPSDELIEAMVNEKIGPPPNAPQNDTQEAKDKFTKNLIRHEQRRGTQRFFIKSTLLLTACRNSLEKEGRGARELATAIAYVDKFRKTLETLFYFAELNRLLLTAFDTLDSFILKKLPQKMNQYTNDSNKIDLTAVGVRGFSGLVDWTRRENRQAAIVFKQAETLTKIIRDNGIFLTWNTDSKAFEFKVAKRKYESLELEPMQKLDYKTFQKCLKVFPEVIEKSYQAIQTGMALRRTTYESHPSGFKPSPFDQHSPNPSASRPGFLNYDKNRASGYEVTTTSDDLTVAHNTGVFLGALSTKQKFVEDITSQVFDDQMKVKNNPSLKQLRLGDLRFISVPLRKNMITADVRDLMNGSSVIFTGGDTSIGGVHIKELAGWELNIEKQEPLPARDLTINPGPDSKQLFDLLSAAANRPELEPNGEADIQDGFDALAAQVRGKAVVGLMLNMLPESNQENSREKVAALKQDVFAVKFGKTKAELTITDDKYVCDFGDGCKGFMVQGIGDEAPRYLETEQWSKVIRKEVSIDPEQSIKSQGSQTLFELTSRSTGQETSSQRVTYTINDWINVDANIVNDFLPKMYLMMPCFPGWVIYSDALERAAPINNWNWVRPKTP